MTDNALRQYIELFEKNREEIDSNSAPAINVRRKSALEGLLHTRLPKKGSENYEIIDLPEILGHDYGVNINRIPLPVSPADSFRCGIPRIATALFFMINDSFAETSESRKPLPEGVEICSLRAKALEDPDLVGRYYGMLADDNNPLVSLSGLLAQDGLWIRVSKGVKVENPVQIVNISGGADNMLTPMRIVVVMEEGAEMRLLMCDHTSHGSNDLLSLRTLEVFALAGSHLDLYGMEESGETSRRLSTLWLRQEAESHVVIDGMTIYNGVTRNEYHCRFAGNDAELRLYGMGIADADRLIDVYSRVDHDCDRCLTDELFKFSLDDRARCAFTGLVKVAEGAVKNEAYQSNRNLVGSDEARMFSKPQLEIYNDDVKCSHGSATGQLDSMQLFYMRTRGIDESEARMLLKQAFMADVIDKVRIPGLKERLSHIVERRFAGEMAGCHDCACDCG
ncbi:MAG: SufD family Fe-S cluster assembly protein [Muribaculaceae bacterium]|nr:SufD family Fe-S cluster assembly protein [Muribaculaceae bacterium]